jgi:glucan biosynthesis protein
MLVEIPTGDEFMDNIVAFWRPQEVLVAGQEYRFAYRLTWTRDQPDVGHLPAFCTKAAVGNITGQAIADMSSMWQLRPKMRLLTCRLAKAEKLQAPAYLCCRIRTSFELRSCFHPATSRLVKSVLVSGRQMDLH